MKLSEAIREGTRQNPQGDTDYVTVAGGMLYTCALGAALVGAGYNPTLEDCGEWNGNAPRRLRETFPQLCDEVIFYPNGGKRELMDAIWLMNDRIGMTREAIADLLERHGY